MKVFAHNLKRMRQDMGWSTHQLKEFSGCSQSYISQLESGEHSPSLEIASRLATALMCDVNDFLKPIPKGGR